MRFKISRIVSVIVRDKRCVSYMKRHHCNLNAPLSGGVSTDALRHYVVYSECYIAIVTLQYKLLVMPQKSGSFLKSAISKPKIYHN